jgi:LAO/AO transport system kinase
MHRLTVHPRCYVRPSPSKGMFGGVTASCAESVALCETGGFNYTAIETVGVGQTETAIDDVCDLVILITTIGGGDGLQTIKKGIMEVADIVVVNKADGHMEEPARRYRAEIDASVRLIRKRYATWMPPVIAVSSHNGYNLDKLWSQILKFQSTMYAEIILKRQAQLVNQCENILIDMVKHKIRRLSEDNAEFKEVEQELMSNFILPRNAA